jgi:preprotein translocase subunit SecF
MTMTEQSEASRTAVGRARGLANRLYRGEAGLDVVGRRRIFYAVAGAILVLAVVSLIVRGFTLGVEFKGGNTFEVPASAGSLNQVRDAVGRAGAEVVRAQVIGGTTSLYRVQTAPLTENAGIDAAAIKAKVAKDLGIKVTDISDNAVSAAWGGQITKKALSALVIFLIFVMSYLSVVFKDWRVAVAAFAALVQNLLFTTAVYVLVGFEVTPSTVIGFLTILGFALYDVVVVFDKVRENTAGITANPNQTYGEAANLAVNQTLMRSINTALVALLPVGGLLFIGAGLLGAGTLKDLGLVLFFGMLAAVYSSIFFATPVLVDLKEQEPRFKLHKQRVLARRASALTDRRGAVEQKAATGKKAAVPAAKPAAAHDTDSEQPAVAGQGMAAAAPRVGARPGPRKRPAGAKPGGARSGGNRGKRR